MLSPRASPHKTSKPILRAGLRDVVTDVELRYKRTGRGDHGMKAKRKRSSWDTTTWSRSCLILADVGGDSSTQPSAARTDKDIIGFCGVRFMAETARFSAHSKSAAAERARRVLRRMASRRGCSALRTNPGVPVVTYINPPPM